MVFIYNTFAGMWNTCAAMRASDPAPLLRVEDLTVEFDSAEGIVRAVRGLTLAVDRGEMVGLVGESGCGKSATALALVGLLPHPGGRVTGGRALLQGEDLLKLDAPGLRAVRGRRIALVFQEPLSALNPVMRVGEQVAEVVRLHGGEPRDAANRKATELLERMGISGADQRYSAYPHQLSGGMRQRVMLAMALAGRPDLLIADEPTTALDPTIQAQVMDVLDSLRRDEGVAVLLITHDLRLAVQRCGRINVMRRGRVVEQGESARLLAGADEPYTRQLLELAHDLGPGVSDPPDLGPRER
jgi:ABC-type dipeptide/oligopeptide/nickel transport system ATPase component